MINGEEFSDPLYYTVFLNGNLIGVTRYKTRMINVFRWILQVRSSSSNSIIRAVLCAVIPLPFSGCYIGHFDLSMLLNKCNDKKIERIKMIFYLWPKRVLNINCMISVVCWNAADDGLCTILILNMSKVNVSHRIFVHCGAAGYAHVI